MSTASRPTPITTGYGETGAQSAPTDPQLTAGAVALQVIGYKLWNWLQFWTTNGVRYLSRTGVATWSSTETYIAGDIVRGTHGSLFVATAGSTNADPELLGSVGWLPYSSAGILGDWTDPDNGGLGDLHVTGSNTTVNGDATYKNVTVENGFHLIVNNGVLRVEGTLKVVSGGFVQPNGVNALDGQAGAAGSGGAGGTGANSSSSGTIFGGSDGGAASLSGGASDGAAIVDAIGSFGGNGGNGSAGTGGSGTAAYVQYNSAVSSSVLQCARNGGQGWKRGGTFSARVPTAFGIQGGCGGGGAGGDGTNKGGGGGAGGGLLLIIANHLDMGADGCLLAAGGKGGNAIGTAGTGGGGGGGAVVVLYRTKTGATLTNANCAPGGAAGTGGGGGGTAGNAGRLYMFQI